MQFWVPVAMAVLGAIFVWKSVGDWRSGAIRIKSVTTRRTNSPMNFYVTWLAQIVFAVFWIGLALFLFCQGMAQSG